jgi:hypothetical protein
LFIFAILILSVAQEMEDAPMQTLAVQVAATFLDDAAALVNGFARIVTHVVMAPVERIANASDVAGVLASRRAALAHRRAAARLWLNVAHGSRRGRGPRRRGSAFGCLGFLGELT